MKRPNVGKKKRYQINPTTIGAMTVGIMINVRIKRRPRNSRLIHSAMASPPQNSMGTTTMTNRHVCQTAVKEFLVAAEKFPVVLEADELAPRTEREKGKLAEAVDNRCRGGRHRNDGEKDENGDQADPKKRPFRIQIELAYAHLRGVMAILHQLT